MELQLAMDLFSLEDAVAMAQRLQADADIIEIGTPLLMREGIRAIRIMQESGSAKLWTSVCRHSGACGPFQRGRHG